MNKTIKLAILRTGSFLSQLAPMGVYVGINWRNIVTTSQAGWSLTIGGVLVCMVVGLQMAGKLGKVLGNGVTVVASMYVILTLLQPILLQLNDILLCVLIGQGVNVIAYNNVIARTVKEIDAGITADATAKSMESVMSKYTGRV